MVRDEDRFDVIIIGAGIGGLTCGYEAARSGLRVLVADRAEEPGGVIRTRRVNGYLLELGPNSFSMSRPTANRILEEAGLTPQMQIRPMRGQARFIWRKERLHLVPTSPIGLLKTGLLSTKEKVRAVSGVFRRFPCEDKDVEAGACFRDRLGDGIVEALLRPAVAGIYAADVDHMSLEAGFPKLYAAMQKQERLIGVIRELIRNRQSPGGARALAGFNQGLQSLPRALAAAITAQGSEVALGESVQICKSIPGSDDRWRVDFSNGRVAVADNVVIAACARGASRLLEQVAERSSALVGTLEYAPLVVVHLGVREEQLSESRAGFGFLTSRGSSVRALGMMWNDSIFEKRAPSGMRLLTGFYGGELDPKVMLLSDEELKEQVRADLVLTMGLQEDFDLFHITRWERAIPLFRCGHSRVINDIVRSLPEGIRLLGSFLGDPSIPGRMEAGAALAGELATWKASVEV